MTKTNLLFRSILTLCCALTFVSAAHAQAIRTWVSGVGDDANPCSRTAPCKTFAGAISKTAATGEIDALDPGGFGAVTITKAITLDGNGTLAGILAPGVNAIIINAGASDTVIIRNLQITGSPGSGGTLGINGINYLAGGNVIIDNVAIERFSNSLINANLSATGNLTVTRFHGQNCGSSPDAAIHATTSSGQVKVSISDSFIQNCAVGISLEDSVVAKIHNTVIQGNGPGIGVRVATTPSGGATVANLDSVLVSHVGEGIRVTTGAAAVSAFLSNNSFLNCGTGSNAGAGVTVTSFGNNNFSNNALDVSGPFTTKAQQ